jgi:mannosyltransferase
VPPAGPDEPDRRRRHALLLGGVVAAAAGLRLAALDLDAFWLDEATTAVISRADPGHLVAQRARSGHPPLFFLLTWLVARVAGNGEVAMRLPAALAGIASVPVLHAVVRRVAGPRPALLAAALLALSPTHLELSLMARAYSSVALAGLVATWLLVADERRRGWRRPAAFAAVHLAAVFCHYSALLTVAVHGGWALSRRRWRFAAAAAVAAAAVLPWLAWVRTLGPRPGGPLAWVPPFGETTLPQLALDLVIDLRGWGALEGWLGPAGGAAAGLALAAVLVTLAAAGAVRARGDARLLAWLWLGPPGLVLAAVAAGSANALHEARWFLVSSAAFSGLLAVGIDGLGGGVARPARWRRPAAATAVLAVLAGGCALELAQPEGTDWRTVARVLAAEKRPGEELLVLPDTAFRLTTLRFYHPGPFRRLGERPWRRDRPPGVWVAWSPGAFAAARRHDSRAAAGAERELRRLRRRLPVERRVPLRSGTLIHLTAGEPAPRHAGPG